MQQDHLNGRRSVLGERQRRIAANCDMASHGDRKPKRLRPVAVVLAILPLMIASFLIGGLVLSPFLGSNTTITKIVRENVTATITHTAKATTIATIAVESPTPQQPTCQGAARCWEGTVTRIVDGDTLEVDSVRIRLALVDTPEWNQAGGPEATQFTTRICPLGSKALVDQDDKQLYDAYGRLLAVVWCSGRNLNRELLYEGIGQIDIYYCTRSEFETQDWAKKYGC